ncbi:MAG: 50S ribosomal protein L11 methyltransferase [Chthoniobacterales bacterium]
MSKKGRPYLWEKSVAAAWVERHEAAIARQTGGTHAVVERPGKTRLKLEVYCPKLADARALTDAFGGSITRLPGGWEESLFTAHKTKPLRIGRRLMIRDEPEPATEIPHLAIPAGVAFGTGEHATTAMSLRLLEEVTRKLSAGWKMLDAGTGSGILALAGRRFGAGDVLAVDNDPKAVRTARANARSNQIRGITFVTGDVAREARGTFDLITANLFSELLISVLPTFRRSLGADGALILSGILRTQERAVHEALRQNGLRATVVRRRGKWIALLVRLAPRPKSQFPPRRPLLRRRGQKLS